jgi:hypothetical protein
MRRQLRKLPRREDGGVPDAAAVDPERVGIAPAELAARASRRSAPVSAGELQHWLLEHDLAVVVDGGLLAPPTLAVEIGEAIVPTKEA